MSKKKAEKIMVTFIRERAGSDIGFYYTLKEKDVDSVENKLKEVDEFCKERSLYNKNEV